MHKFSDFAIEEMPRKTMDGDHIKVDRILNREIVVHFFDIRISKYPEKGNGMCLYIQIELDGIKRVVWTGSVFLQYYIQKVQPSQFPFTAKIVKDNDSYKFA